MVMQKFLGDVYNKNYILWGNNMYLEEYENENCNLAVGKYKIKNGSKFIAGGKVSQLNLMLDQHFNWFQKLMWKWCFGVKVEDYSDE